MDRSARLEHTLAATRRRLRLRNVTRGVAAAVHPALLLAGAVAVTGRLIDLPRPVVGLAALAATTAVLAGAAAIGLLARGLDRRSLALLVDRLGATDETVLTALHVSDPDAADPNRAAILERFDRLDLAPRALLPLERPRHLRWAPLEVLAVALCLLLVPPALGWPLDRDGGPAVREGERLEERLAEIDTQQPPEGAPLPDDIERELAGLADDLRDGELTADEARERMSELQQRLADFEQRLAPSADLLQDLEQAAQQLQGEGTDRLSEALSDGDLGAAADAARDLSESLAEASPEERQRAAEALEQAGEALKQSSDPALQRAGEAMRSAGQQMADPRGASQQASGDRAGTPGPDGPPGSDAANPGAPSTATGSGLSPQQAAELARELRQAQELGQQLARDQAALQRSQALNGALEGSRQRLGGEPQVAGGQSSAGQQGQGEGAGQGQGRGQGEGEGDGTGESGPNGAAGAGHGVGSSGHTWEDEGEFTGGEGEGPRDRLSDRRGGTHVDDFEKLYEEMRLAGAQSLLAGVDGAIDEQGHVDQLPIRVTTGDEGATAATVEIPASWRDQAVEAIEAEPVPPAYEQAVKRYFDVK